MDNLDIKQAIKYLSTEKGVPENEVKEILEAALAAAYRKDFGDKTQNVQAEYDLDKNKLRIFDAKEVVEDLTEEELKAIEEWKAEKERLRDLAAQGILPKKEDLRGKREEMVVTEDSEDEEKRHFNARTQIQLKEAKETKKTAKLGDIIKTELEIPGDFGRMAAQTAKQVIIQRVKEAERNIIFEEYKDKQGTILNGTVRKFEGPNVIIDLDSRTSGILPLEQQIRGERYKVGERIKVYLISVDLAARGPSLLLSRTHPEIVKELFYLEIPEIESGLIKIEGVAREAGGRTKVSVSTEEDNLDPIGSCIGQRGIRIQTIINELGGEKIDIIEHDENPKKYIANALMPAKILKVELVDEDNKEAVVTVEAEQLSLTIGRGGQNVRLATKLTGWLLKVKEKESGEEVLDNEDVSDTDLASENSSEDLQEESSKEEKSKKKSKKKETKKVEEK